MPDHRRHRRTRVRQQVWCENDDVTVFTRTLNASAGGMFIRTPTPPEAGRRLRVSFDDHGCQVVAEVEVVWSRPAAGRGTPGMGVRILEFESGSECYRRFVDRHLKSGSSPGMILTTGLVDPRRRDGPS